MEPCPTCGGRQYLLDQTYGEADIPDGWTPVQACDACSTDLSDEDAAKKAAREHRTTYEWFEPERQGDDPGVGDWAIEGHPYASLKDVHSAINPQP